MILLAFLFLFGLIIFILPMFKEIINIGNISGSIICLFGLLLFFFYDGFLKLIFYFYSNTILRVILIASLILIIIFILYLFFISILMLMAILNSPKKLNTLVVLGCRVKGTKPTRMLVRRLEAAYKYLAKNPEVLCIVSGGKGLNEIISEAQAMKTYLVEKGISDFRIIIEDKSATTFQNLKFSKKIIDNMALGKDITIVTDGYHQFRSCLIAKKLGLNAKSLFCKTRKYLIPTYWVREWFCILNELLLRGKAKG